MNEIEIGPGKRARIAYSFDDIAIVPSRRTRDPEEVSIQWQIDAYKFGLPMLAAPMDSVVSLILKGFGPAMKIHASNLARSHHFRKSKPSRECRSCMPRRFSQS